jgi:hypothetical protein
LNSFCTHLACHFSLVPQGKSRRRGETAIYKFLPDFSLIAWLEDLKRQAETTNASVIFVEKKKASLTPAAWSRLANLSNKSANPVSEEPGRSVVTQSHLYLGYSNLSANRSLSGPKEHRKKIWLHQ